MSAAEFFGKEKHFATFQGTKCKSPLTCDEGDIRPFGIKV